MEFPSPFGVLSFLIRLYPSSYVYVSPTNFRLLSEFSHFLFYINIIFFHYYILYQISVSFRSSLISYTSFIFLGANFIILSGFRLLSEFSHFLYKTNFEDYQLIPSFRLLSEFSHFLFKNICSNTNCCSHRVSVSFRSSLISYEHNLQYILIIIMMN